MTEPVIINQTLLDEVSHNACQNPRQRKNHNFHAANESACHRLLNAIEPGSYIPPHRHLDPEKGEGMVILRGKLGLVFFDETGKVTRTVVMTPGGEVVAVDIPPGVYHSLVSLAPDTLMYEAKAGPYLALTNEEKASWAPGENSDGAAAYYESLRRLFG